LKKIIQYLKDFKNIGHHAGYVTFLVLFTSIFIYLYYGIETFQDLKMEWRQSPQLFIYYFLLYSIPFFGSYIAYTLFYKQGELWKDKGFLSLMFLSVFVFTLRSCSHVVFDGLLGALRGWEHQLYWYRIIMNIVRGLLIMIPIALYWFIKHRKEQPLYGFSLKKFDTSPYFIMLLLMVPLITIASINADFLGQYPRAGNWGLEQFDINVRSDWKYFALFEFIYGLDFISIEFFFRGFLVLAFVRYAGPHVILPMAVFYVFIHFGKPLGETISSFFGGTLLGIISYYGKSIYGGIIVHMGIAWLMEIGALISKMTKV